MTKILLLEKSHKAKDDLKQIWRYTYRNYGDIQANKYHNELDVQFNLLLTNPYIGVSCDYIQEGYRKYHTNKHFIIYKILKDTIYIVRVLSDKMDYNIHL
ncbi:type II toxin-antitoxin system RelE/ParE family toxin [Rickettsiales bacterium LUAb2]